MRNTTWAQLSVRYGLPSRLLCPSAERSRLESNLKVQADLFEAHIGGFWLSYPEEERDSKATPILRAYFRQLLERFFPMFRQARGHAAAGPNSRILPPRPTKLSQTPNDTSTGSAAILDSIDDSRYFLPVVDDHEVDMVLDDDDDMDLGDLDTDDDWFEVIGSHITVIS